MFYVCIFNFFVLLSVISFLSVIFLSGKKRAQRSWECYNWSFCWYTAFDSSVSIQLHMIPNMVNLSPHFQFSFWHTMYSFMFIYLFIFCFWGWAALTSFMEECCSFSVIMNRNNLILCNFGTPVDGTSFSLGFYKLNSSYSLLVIWNLIHWLSHSCRRTNWSCNHSSWCD